MKDHDIICNMAGESTQVGFGLTLGSRFTLGFERTLRSGLTELGYHLANVQIT